MTPQIEDIKSPLSLTHVFVQYYQLGGVHACLKLHFDKDQEYGLDSKFIITFEKQERPQPIPRIFFLGLNENTTPKLYRHRFQQAVAYTKSDLLVYHTLEPESFALDGARRRILYLNSQWPGMEHKLRRLLPWFDGIFTVSEPLRDLVNSCSGQDRAGRVFYVPVPIQMMPPRQPKPCLTDRDLIIGVAGRLVKPAKRLDLLPSLVRDLEKSETRFRMEILGDGPLRGWLEGQLPDRDRFLFHGAKQGQEYWNILANWDVIFSTSEVEGASIAILEAMSMGVLPVFPDIPSQNQFYLKNTTFSWLLYRSQQWKDVIDLLSRIRSLSEAARGEIQHHFDKILSQHRPEKYMDAFAKSAATISSMAPRASPQAFKRPWYWDRLTYKQHNRVNSMIRKSCGFVDRALPFLATRQPLSQDAKTSPCKSST